MKTIKALVLSIALGTLATPHAAGQANFTTIYTFDGAEANGLAAGNGVL